MTPQFIDALDEARKKEHVDRSTFIRAAIAEDLRRRGCFVDEEGIHAPDRTRKPVHYVTSPDQTLALNESSSKADLIDRAEENHSKGKAKAKPSKS